MNKLLGELARERLARQLQRQVQTASSVPATAELSRKRPREERSVGDDLAQHGTRRARRRESDSDWRERLQEEVPALPPEGPRVAAEREEYEQCRPEHSRVRIVSWNIAELKSSRVAPACWTAHSQEAAVRSLVMAEDPDVLCLQECPRSDFNIDPSSYVLVGSAPSHCGWVCLFVRRQWKLGPDYNPSEEAADHPVIQKIVKCPGPAVAALFGNDGMDAITDFAVVGVHLEPFGEGAETRRKQLDEIGDSLWRVFGSSRSGQPAVVVVGDTNMRNAEVRNESKAREFGSFLYPLRHVPYRGMSWDSKRNHFNGREAFQFTCQFDRVFLGTHTQRGDYVFNSGADAEVKNLRLIADQPVSEENPNHFLSDHFGLAFEVILFEDMQP